MKGYKEPEQPEKEPEKGAWKAIGIAEGRAREVNEPKELVHKALHNENL